MTNRIIIDVTSLLHVPFVSGIQRVAGELLPRLLLRRASSDSEFLLVEYVPSKQGFYSVSNDDFLRCFHMGSMSSSAMKTKTRVAFDTLTSRDTFFDIDSVWNNQMRRSFLLPVLKKKGVRIIACVYDIIPVLYPQFCDAETTIRFMNYLAAHLMYADILITNSESTGQDIRDLADRLGVTNVPQFRCVPLGANFIHGKESTENKIDPRAIEFANKRYLLMVGTIEPRKNHDYVLCAYQEYLRELGISLVIAGRKGWDVEDVMEKIIRLDQSDPQFAYFDHANDETIHFLYSHAFFTVFPSVYEGFGLPIIESFQHQTPVVASDIDVFREIGGDLCEYLDLRRTESLSDIVRAYLENPELRTILASRLKGYTPVTWDDTEEILWTAIRP